MNRERFRGLSDLVCAGVKPLTHFTLKTPSPIFTENENGDLLAEYTNKILAEVVDTADKAIVDAIIREAAAQGVNDLFLIDRDFIMSAIKHEIIRRIENENSHIR